MSNIFSRGKKLEGFAPCLWACLRWGICYFAWTVSTGKLLFWTVGRHRRNYLIFSYIRGNNREDPRTQIRGEIFPLLWFIPRGAFFSAGEHWSKVPRSLFGAQHGDFTCLWISSSSFSETFSNKPKYFTWSKNRTRISFRKAFDGAGCLSFLGQKRTSIFCYN